MHRERVLTSIRAGWGTSSRAKDQEMRAIFCALRAFSTCGRRAGPGQQLIWKCSKHWGGGAATAHDESL